MKKPLLPFFICSLFLGISSCKVPQENQNNAKPNIVFILADDLGFGDIEPYGQSLIKTPSLNKMADEGMKFNRHYAGTSVCAPSRCALITGLHTGHCQVRGNKQDGKYGQLPLSDSEITVAELLKSAGYTTGMIGKWGLGETGTTGDPNKQGFDFFYGYTDQVLAHNHFPEYLIRNGQKEYLNNEVKYVDSSAWHAGRGSYSTKKVDFADELFTNEALKFISDNKEKPFFLYLPYIIPHDNGEAEKGEYFEAPDQLGYVTKEWTKEEKDYAASITYLDKYVGQILDHLKQLGLDKNTLVIFTSDNGPYAATRQMRFNSSGGLRGIKRDLYEGGIREPFIAWWPGTIKSGSETDHASAFWDFMPTACELAGVASSSYNTDGISYVPTLLNKADQKKHDYLYFEFHEQGGSQAVILDNWKLVKNKINTDNPQQPELYDLSKDESEQKNIANENPEILDKLHKISVKARVPSKEFPLKIDSIN